MSIKIMSAVFESETLGPTERLIMLALADHADDAGRCYPSISRLSQRTGLSERAVQTNIRKLVEQGYIRIVAGGGKGNTNLYFVSANPAEGAPLDTPKPRSRCTPQQVHPAAGAPQTPQQVRPNPAAGAPEPSGTTIEPSDVIPRASPVGILTAVVSPRMAKSFVAFRSKMKKPMNEIAAERLVKSLQKIADQGGCPEDALGLCQEKGWQSIKPEWYFKDLKNGQSSRATTRPAAQSDAFRDLINDAAAMRRTSGADWH